MLDRKVVPRDEIAVAPLVLPHMGRVVQVREQLFEQGLALLSRQLNDLAPLIIWLT